MKKINMFIFLKAISESVFGDDSRYDTGAINRKSLSDGDSSPSTLRGGSGGKVTLKRKEIFVCPITAG